MWYLGADLPFVLLLSSFSQKVWDIWPRWPSVTTHQLHKLPPTERKGNLWEKPKEDRFLPSPYRKGRKSVPRHVSSERCTTSPVCLAPGMLQRQSKSLEHSASFRSLSPAPKQPKPPGSSKPKVQVVSFPEKPPKEVGLWQCHWEPRQTQTANHNGCNKEMNFWVSDGSWFVFSRKGS